MEQKLLDFYATAVIAEVQRQVSIAPDILLGHCVRLRFDLYFVGMVVAPNGAVASTNRALAYVDVPGSQGTVTVMVPQWQLERIEVSVAAMLSRVVQLRVC